MRQYVLSSLAALLLGLSYDATQLPLLPIYGSVATSQHHVPLFYTLHIASAWFKGRWSLETGCWIAACALVVHPLSLWPSFRCSSELGTTVGPLTAQMVLGAPVVLALGGPLYNTLGKVTAGILVPLVFEAARRGILVSTSTLLRGHELFGYAACLTALGLLLSSLVEPDSTRASKKSRQRNKKSSKSPQTSTPRLACLALYLALSLSSYFFSRPRLALVLPWTQNRHGPQVLASTQSTTGKVAVIEYEFHPGQWLRALKADHSLLGGIWIGPARAEQMRRTQRAPERVGLADEAQAVELAQSIFNTFYLQEAVRLVQREESKEQRALIIGLGTGISARALARHGVDVVIAEIDPAVYHYAQEFFGVRTPQAGLYLEDARRTLARPNLQPFDFVIHDVFTGGSVPAALFTLEFWQQVKKRLKTDGVLAVNFAGDLNSPASLAILHTLTRSFVSSRAFDDGTPGDYKNLVIFCTDVPRLDFRQPEGADYLDLPARQEVLDHFLERKVSLEISGGSTLTDHNSSVLDSWQHASALQHWRMLRDQIGSDFWMA